MGVNHFRNGGTKFAEDDEFSLVINFHKFTVWIEKKRGVENES